MFLLIRAGTAIGCNPQLLVNAIERYLPEQKPDFARIKRLEIYDEQGNPFR